LVKLRFAGNESMALGDLRTIGSAQAVYAERNGGAYDTIACLARPEACLPGYAGPSFLDTSFLAPRRHGYVFTFHPGAAAAAGPARSPSSLAGWAALAVPEDPRGTGGRALCLDSAGAVRSTDEAAPPPPPGGACPAAWTPLR
jgi:hypothetical protein